VGYLANAADPVPLVLDLHITHDRFESSCDPTLNGTLHYPNPNDIDRSLNEPTDDKIRRYHTDYNNNPPNVISFIPVIPSTSDRLHSEFIRLLFLQTHRETDRFFATSGVQSAQLNLGSSYFHFRRAAFSSILKSKCGNILAKAAALRINLNLDGARQENWTYSYTGTHFIYYESRKGESKTKPVYECRCDERIKTKTETSTRLSYTGLHGELENIKIKTRLIDEMFTSVMGECVFLK
jgi:hypothetical protein